MKVFYCDHFVLPLPVGHRFPMDKYRLLRERVAREGAGRFELREPQAAQEADLALAHDAAYIERVAAGRLSDQDIRALGFPWSTQLVERSRRSSGATIEAARAALAEGTAVNLAGGTHHAHHDRPQGFCVFNDAAVAARVMQRDGRVARVLIVDCDVHQGNGTAAILRQDPSVYTFSIHGARNFPFRKEASDLDVALADGASDGVYLDALGRGLARAFAEADAGLVIYLAGADPYAGDRWGRMGLSKSGLRQRDEMVFAHCRRLGVPVAVAMAGGYAPDVNDIVDIHFQTVVAAADHRGC